VNYELAKQLKDAGWKTRTSKCFWGNSLVSSPVNGELREDEFYAPNLSELIEACGSEFYQLVLTYDGWSAASGLYQRLKSVTVAKKTPEEAVAMLWIALNKK
jgi:hypothetical protein